MKNEQRAATGWNVESYRLRISRIIQNMDQEAILENAVTVERSVRDVIKRPRYFRLTKTPDRLSYLIQWTDPSNLASGLSKRHPYRGQHGQ